MNAGTPRVSVVLPTYNEAESLPVIVRRIERSLGGAGIAYEVIVVDDNSPDGTVEVARELAATFPLQVIHRTTERGLATAVLAGFSAARSPLCVVMDADGSHPSSVLPTMVRLLEDDKADIVVGSRHVAGGGSQNWPLFSQLKSKLAAMLTFGLTSVTDPTTGLMGIRKSLLTGLDLDPVGWKIVLEIVVKAAPARIAEVPIVFEDRELGESKQSLRVFAEYAAHLGKLYAFRYPGLAELSRFCLVGLLGVVVDLATVAVFKESFDLDTRLCAVLGFTAAVSSNFLLNRLFTFARARELPALYSYLTYVGANLVGLSLRVLIVHLLMVLTALEQGRGYLVSNFIGIAIATLVNFIGAKYLAFDPERFAGVRESRAPLPPSVRTLPSKLVPVYFVLLTALALWSLCDATLLRELRSHDEGVNLTMAVNIAHDARRLLEPSVFPGGRQDFVVEDLPSLGNTPFFALLLSPLALGGLSLAGLLPWLSTWIAIACTMLLLRCDGSRAPAYTGLLLASSPAFMARALELELEPTMIAFCAAGLLCFVTGAVSQRDKLCLVGGALLGFGFLTKLWLVAPYVFAACAFLLVHATLGRARANEPLHLRRKVLLGLLGFMIVASLHLSLVAWLTPESLRAWVSSVYLGILSGEGITAGKLSAQGPWAESIKPVWYYPALLAREHLHVLLLCLLGLPALVRRMRTPAAYVLAMAFGALLALVPLSVPAVKEPLFVLGVVPLLYALAALSLCDLEADAIKHGPANRALARLLGPALALAAVATAAWLWTQDAPLADESVQWATLTLLFPALFVARGVITRLPLAGRVAGIGAVGLCALVAAAFARAPAHERELAQAIAPSLVDVDPAYPSFAAKRHGVLMGYLGRAGMSLEQLSRGDVRTPVQSPAVIVIDPESARDPALAAWIKAVEASSRPLDAAPLPAGYRVLLRPR